jgi:hypothetical protein
MLERESELDSMYSSLVKLNQMAQLVLLFVAFALVLAPTCSAQVLYGSLTGTVTDPSGALVSGARVTALEVRTAVASQATTDTAGIYRFTTLLPGTYKVTIDAPSFSTQETLAVPVRVNEVARVDARLQVASTSQSVVVTTEAPLLQTDKSDRKSVV